MNREKLHRILDLVLQLNEQGYTTFCDIAGHVETVHVRVYKGRWKYNKDMTCNMYAYYKVTDIAEEDTLDEIIEKLEELKGETKK